MTVTKNNPHFKETDSDIITTPDDTDSTIETDTNDDTGSDSDTGDVELPTDEPQKIDGPSDLTAELQPDGTLLPYKQKTITIANDGDLDLEIASIYSCALIKRHNKYILCTKYKAFKNINVPLIMRGCIALADPTHFALEPLGLDTIPPQGAAELVVRYAPQAAGNHRTQILIHTNIHVDSPFSIDVSGQGVEGQFINALEEWVIHELESYQDVDYYYLDVVEGETYLVLWDDRNGTGTYTADIAVSGLDEDFDDVYFREAEDGITTPPSFTAETTGTAILMVEAEHQSNSSAGTYALVVTTP